MNKVDYSKVSPELREKLLEFEKNNPANQQLQKLQDIALMLQDIIMTDDEERKSSNKTKAEFGALLTDVREQLIKLNDKESPEIPDNASPVVAVVDKLIEKLDAKEFSPKIEVKAPQVKVDAPKVNVNAPDVDLRGMEKIVREELPEVFTQAIKDIVAQIPKTEIPEYPDRWNEVLEWLESIDTATRMKPLPGSMIVTNPDGSSIGSVSGSTTYITIIREDAGDPQISYIGKAVPGTATSDAAWQIASLDENTNLDLLYADGGAFTQVYDDRESLTYA